MKTVDGRAIVRMKRVPVREFRAKFTGADCYHRPVEVRAYGRLVGYWFPPGTLPATVAPRAPGQEEDDERPDDPGLLPLQPGAVKRRAAPTSPGGSALSERQRQRDEWLKKINRTPRSGGGY